MPAAVAREVGEEARVVARAAERGYVLPSQGIALPHGAQVDGWVGGDGLEEVHRLGAHVVQLLQVDECQLGECQAVVLAHRVVEVLDGEVLVQRGRQQVGHERGLVLALLLYR